MSGAIKYMHTGARLSERSFLVQKRCHWRVRAYSALALEPGARSTSRFRMKASTAGFLRMLLSSQNIHAAPFSPREISLSSISCQANAYKYQGTCGFYELLEQEQKAGASFMGAPEDGSAARGRRLRGDKRRKAYTLRTPARSRILPDLGNIGKRLFGLPLTRIGFWERRSSKPPYLLC